MDVVSTFTGNFLNWKFSKLRLCDRENNQKLTNIGIYHENKNVQYIAIIQAILNWNT